MRLQLGETDAPALSMQSQYNAVRCGRTFPSYALRDVGSTLRATTRLARRDVLTRRHIEVKTRKTTAGIPHLTRCMRSIGVGVSASVAVGYGAPATGDEE